MNQKQNDFDSLVRRLADEADSPFHESSWQKMEVLLDQKKKRKAIWWFWPLTLAITLFGTFSLAYFNRPTQFSNAPSFSNNTSLDNNYDKGASSAELHFTVKNIFSTSIIQEQSSAVDNLDKLLVTNKTTLNQKIKSNSLSSIENPIENKAKSTSNNPTNNNPSSLTKSESKSIDYKKASDQRAAENNSNPSLNNNLSKRKNIVPSAFSAIKNKKDDRAISPSNESSKKSNITAAIESTEITTDHIITEEEQEIKANKQSLLVVYPLPMNIGAINERQRTFHFNTLPNTSVVQTTPKPVKQNRYITFSATYAPEWTHVPSRDFGKRSNAFGFGIGYTFLKHLTFYTGWQQTNKLYHATGEDYTITPGTYWEGKSIFDINAVCKVTEWPILLGYQMNLKNNNKLVINIGTASLKMNSEKYDYMYSYYPSGPKRARNLLVENNNWEWFAAGVLSINYIKPIAKNLSVSLSPYFKTPLKGIGIGKIDLQSLGGQIGLHYNIRSPF